MTREEREKVINNLKILKEDYWEDDGYGHETEDYKEMMWSLDIVINALEESCDDTVSRQVALSSLEELDWDTAYERSQVEEMLKSLPFVIPISKDKDKGVEE